MKIASVALNTVWKDCSQNLSQTEHHVSQILKLYPKVDIILFPELSLMGFVTDSSNRDIAESLDGYCVNEIKRIAKANGVALICGIIEQNNDDNPYNTSFVISKEGELLAQYRKNHLFTQSPEPTVFSAGQELATFELEGWKCGLATCFDIRFPRLFEAYKKANVECIFSGFNWVEGRNKPAIMENLVKVRAHENQCFFVAVDRSGADPNTRYYGTRVISNPYCEDVAIKQGIYAYAEIAKDDISTLRSLLPLTSSFKSEYSFQ